MIFFKKKDLEYYLKKFVNKLNKNIMDEYLYDKVLQHSIAWNRIEILEDLIKNFYLLKDYDENIDFNYKPYLEKLRRRIG